MGNFRHIPVAMKQVEKIVLGGLAAAVMIACDKSSSDGATATPTKLDSDQVGQIITAIKNPKWVYSFGTYSQLKKAGEDGWELVAIEKDTKGIPRYVMKKRID